MQIDFDSKFGKYLSKSASNISSGLDITNNKKITKNFLLKGRKELVLKSEKSGLGS